MADNNLDSMSQLLNDIRRIYTNAQSYIKLVHDAIESTEDILNIQVENEDGSTSTIQVPSFANIERRMKIFEQNLNALVGAGTGALDNSLYAQLVDEYGKVKTLVHMSLLNVPDSITSLRGTLANDNQVVALGNDLSRTTTLGLHVQLDVTGKVSTYMQKCQITKFVCTESMFNALQKLEATYGRELTHGEVLDAIDTNGWIEDDDYDIESFVSTLRPRRPMSQGAFNILVKRVTGTNTISVRLDTLSYSNTDARVEGSQVLKLGDRLATATGDVVFGITAIDQLSNTVQLVREEGLQMPSANLDKLVYVDKVVVKCVDVPLRYNEKFVAFLSPVHDFYGTVAAYSPAILIDIAKLTIRDSQNQLINANSYALAMGDSNIGAYLEAIATDALPPAKYAIKPDTLTLSEDMFKVVQLNTHLTDNVDKTKILQLYSQKRSLQQEITGLDTTISSLQLQLNTQNYRNDNERAQLQSQYLSYSKQRAQKVETLQSIIDQMLDIDVAAYDALYDPKFRIRGFIPVQEPSVSKYTAPQNIIQFKVQYRYVSLNDVVAKADTFDVSDNEGGVTTAAYSTWNEVFTPLRRKILSDGQIVWEPINASSIEAICCNQLDVPITPNEKVQIRIKAIGEAGYPNVLNESKWSNILTITFPDSLAASAQFVALKDELLTDKQQMLLENMLTSKGVLEHVADSLTENQTYFAHNAQNLASGFFNDNLSRISVYQKLLDLTNGVSQLRDIIINAGSMLRVSIIDEYNNETEILNGSTTVLYAGAYSDVFDLTKSENYGSILSKQYYIKFTNIGSTPINIYPKYHGPLNQWVPNEGNTDNDKMYTVPISPMSNAYENVSDVEGNKLYWSAPKGSRQSLGQIVYASSVNIAGTETLYMSYDKDTTGHTILLLTNNDSVVDSTAAEAAKKYIAFAPMADQPNTANPEAVTNVALKSNIDISNFALMTTQHPKWQEWLNAKSEDAKKMVSKEIYDILHEQTLIGDAIKSTYQYALPLTNLAESNAPKTMFVMNDKYLCGSNTRGAYMTLNPVNQPAMQVSSSADDAAVSVGTGSSNAVLVPLLFQARMTDATGAIDGTDSIDSAQFKYMKYMAFRTYIGGKEFAFDIKIYADFRSTSSIISSMPVVSMNALLK